MPTSTRKKGDYMKLQGVAIIFIMIAFPMILVLSYYLGLQIDTIK